MQVQVGVFVGSQYYYGYDVFVVDVVFRIVVDLDLVRVVFCDVDEFGCCVGVQIEFVDDGDFEGGYFGEFVFFVMGQLLRLWW